MHHSSLRSAERYRQLLVVSLLILMGTSLSATSIIPPRHLADLAADSDAVVLARAVESTGTARGRLVFTDTTFEITQVVSGDLQSGETVRVQTPGGQAEGQEWIVLGSPRFVAGESYFLCLKRKDASVWQPNLLAYGVLHEEIDSKAGIVLTPVSEGREISAFPRLDGADVERIVPYRKTKLIEHLGEVLRSHATWDAATATAPTRLLKGVTAPDPGCFTFSNSGRKLRWRVFDFGGSITIFADSGGDPSFAADEFALIPEALQLWMDVRGPIYDLQYGGTRATNINCTPENLDVNPNTIVFDDPCSDLPPLTNCNGTLAVGGVLPGGTHVFQGEVWATVGDWIVVVNNGTGCVGETLYRLVLAHELGHGLGFSHVSDANAMMNGTCCNNINLTDEICARTLYPHPADPVSDVTCACNAGGGIDVSWTNDPAATSDPIFIQVNGEDWFVADGTDTSYELIEEEVTVPSGITEICVQNVTGVPVCCAPPANDCDGNGIPDDCDLTSGRLQDCNNNGQPDGCEIAAGLPDCDGNIVPDECEIASGATDCNNDNIPDSCQLVGADCDSNGHIDACDIAAGAPDCNDDQVPDVCQLTGMDCNNNNIPDACDIDAGAPDCNNNGIIDTCEIVDCNDNGTPDDCDIANGISTDCNDNLVPDECDIATGTLTDTNGNDVPDECEGLQLPGDVNVDGGVDVSDAISLFRILFAGATPDLPCGDGTLDDPSNRVLLDHNDDTTVNLADGVATLNWLFGSGTPPSAGETCVALENCADGCTP